MAIRVKCSGCGKTIKGGDDWAGKTANCPHCSTIVKFPVPATFVSPEEPPEAWLSGPVPPLPPIATLESPPSEPSVSVKVVEHANGNSPPPILTTEKRILPAFLLAFFFGGLGAHRFYAGRVRSAKVLLAVTLFGIPFVIFNGVVGLIQQSQRGGELAQLERQMAATKSKLMVAFKDLSQEGVAKLDKLLVENQELTDRYAKLQVQSMTLGDNDFK